MVDRVLYSCTWSWMKVNILDLYLQVNSNLLGPALEPPWLHLPLSISFGAYTIRCSGTKRELTTSLESETGTSTLALVQTILPSKQETSSDSLQTHHWVVWEKYWLDALKMKNLIRYCTGIGLSTLWEIDLAPFNTRVKTMSYPMSKSLCTSTKSPKKWKM